MTKEEYYKAVKVIEDRKRNDINKLKMQYATENAEFGIGDIIEDVSGRIRIDKIFPNYITHLPDTMYYGPRLRKSDSTPIKSGEWAYVGEGVLVQKGKS